jgi:Outer membrane cobalamin receptor protein
MYLDESYVEVNPERMRPVRTTSIAYQLDWNVSREWRTNVLVYVSQDKDMWFWGDRDANGLYTPEVIEKVNIGGLKVATEYNWTESFSHFFSLNLRNIQSEDTRYEFVPYEPKQKISMGITYRFAPNLKMSIAGDYFGRRYYQGDSRESSSGYFLLGSKLAYEAKDYLTFFVLIDNLLNDHYEIVKGYPNQGRNALSGIMIRF